MDLGLTIISAKFAKSCGYEILHNELQDQKGDFPSLKYFPVSLLKLRYL